MAAICHENVTSKFFGSDSLISEVISVSSSSRSLLHKSSPSIAMYLFSFKGLSRISRASSTWLSVAHCFPEYCRAPLLPLLHYLQILTDTSFPESSLWSRLSTKGCIAVYSLILIATFAPRFSFRNSLMIGLVLIGDLALGIPD